MDNEARKNQIVDVLRNSTAPITGTELARRCHVSRQIIVGDVALMRAKGIDIISTPRGYQLGKNTYSGVTRTFVVRHSASQMEDELNTIVDNGGIVHNVIVEHEVYGYLEGALHLRSRRDVAQYVKRMKDAHAELLSEISGGIHSHVVEARTEEDLDAIGEALKKMCILCDE
jgi:transcriptional regulator of NAD metabolism